MLKTARLYNIIIALSLVLAACQSAGTVASQKERDYTAFGVPERVTIRGYGDHAMEPFITRDGRYLFFNNSNDPSVNTNLRYRSTRKTATHPFDPPVRVAAITGFVEAPALSLDGRSLYYHLREGARFVIYRVTRSL